MINKISKGIIFILAATLAFAIMNVMAKDLSGMHPMQVVFLRAFGTYIFIFPYMLHNRISFIGNHPKILFLRGLLGLLSLSAFFVVIQRIPLGSAISIRYLGPIFGAILAFYFLKEKINKFQWLSFFIAFLGVIILKGFDLRIDIVSLVLILISAVLVGCVFVLIRYLGDKEHYLTIIHYFMLITLIVSIFFTSSWRMPFPNEWISAFGIGIFGLVGQIFMTRAFQLEAASIIAPFKYMELVYALILGYVYFGESYRLFAFAGIFFIVTGMILNVYFKKLN